MRPAADEPFPEVYTAMGAILSTYLRNCDLATLGSPNSNTLMSPRRRMPSIGQICAKQRNKTDNRIRSRSRMHQRSRQDNERRGGCFPLQTKDSYHSYLSPLLFAATTVVFRTEYVKGKKKMMKKMKKKKMMMMMIIIISTITRSKLRPYISSSSKEQAGNRFLDIFMTEDFGCNMFRHPVVRGVVTDTSGNLNRGKKGQQDRSKTNYRVKKEKMGSAMKLRAGVKHT